MGTPTMFFVIELITSKIVFQAESEIAKYMKQMLIALGFPKPPEGITPFQLFTKVESKVSMINVIIH